MRRASSVISPARGRTRTKTRHYFQKIANKWRLISEPEALVPKQTTDPPIRVELRQDPNTPPALYAVEVSTGRERLILDLNPQLKGFTLGRVEDATWRDAKGQVWSGRLYFPVGYRRGERYPLVIQDTSIPLDSNRHIASQEFSLDGTFSGAGTGPGISVYAAQPLANRGIAVLSLTSSRGPEFSGTPREGEVAVDAYESAVEHFREMGIVDASKVGIVGFSRAGYRILYALTHSNFPFAAAVVADNVDFGYWQRVFYSGNDEFESVNGAPPFGPGLQSWIKNAPAFNVEKIRTPLRLHHETGPLSTTLFMGWEMFSRLRTLGRPVELYVIPDIEHGAHPVQNPGQVRANKEAAVDWLVFWLTGQEDAAREKADQYKRWRTLRELQQGQLH